MKKSEKSNDPTRQSGNEKPVSLAPLSFQEALAGILEVPPDRMKEASAKKRTAKKRAAKK